jgi:hypothetical protein
MRRYILALLAALAIVVLAYRHNNSGVNPPTPARVLPNLSELRLR